MIAKSSKFLKMRLCGVCNGTKGVRGTKNSMIYCTKCDGVGYLIPFQGNLPSNCPPRSSKRLAAYAYRAENNFDLWHPHDTPKEVGEGSDLCVY